LLVIALANHPRHVVAVPWRVVRLYPAPHNIGLLDPWKFRERTFFCLHNHFQRAL